MSKLNCLAPFLKLSIRDILNHITNKDLFFLPELLQKQHSLETLGGAVRDSVTLVLVAKWPCAQGLVAVALDHVGWVLLDLAVVQELETSLHGLVVLGLVGQPALDHSLDQQGSVPELRSVGSVHHHAILGHPVVCS